jgi:transposase
MSNAAAAEREFVLRAEYDALCARCGELERALQSSREENARIYEQMLWLKKQIFGRKSEKLDINQLALFEPVETPLVEEGQEIEVPAHTRHKPSGRKPLPKDLPRERIEYFPEETVCGTCHQELKRIGEEITEELDFVPSRLVVREHAKVKLACPHCKDRVVTAELPPEVQPIERGRPGVGLLVYLIISKFCDHLPLYRLEQMFAREGVEIARQRMWDWLGAIADQLKALHRTLLAEILMNSYVQADETTIKVQLGEVEGKLHTGYFWAVHAPPNLVYYRYSPTRAEEVPLELFATYRGFVQTDLYAGYNAVFLPQECTRLGCFAHVRRKFIDKGGASNKDSNDIIQHIAKLYKVESEAKGVSFEERRALRERKSVPLLEQLFVKIDALNQRLLPQHPLREATEYALKQKEALMRYTSDGQFEIDNNAIERQMRPIAVGRKNYLFAGSNGGAEAAAIFYSLINSCKLNNINPRDYLCDVIRRLPTHPASRIAELLPHNWQRPVSQ